MNVKARLKSHMKLNALYPFLRASKIESEQKRIDSMQMERNDKESLIEIELQQNDEFEMERNDNESAT